MRDANPKKKEMGMMKKELFFKKKKKIRGNREARKSPRVFACENVPSGRKVKTSSSATPPNTSIE